MRYTNELLLFKALYSVKRKKHMIKKLFFLSLIICTSQSYAMKRSAEDLKISESQFPHYDDWFPDIKRLIIGCSTTHTLAKKPKDATYPIKALSHTNKELNRLINNPTFSDNLIKTFAQKFYCSHETIARDLDTKQARQRLALQYDLKCLCIYKEFSTNYRSLFPQPLTVELDNLIARKVDLEFTYNLGLLQRTPVMLSLDNKNMLKLLLEKGANINGCNVHEFTPLKLSTESPIHPRRYKKLLNHPSLNINQQNKHGESALLRCLVRRKCAPSMIFIVMIIRLIKAGADPELANNDGVTPIKVARRLGDVLLINIIQEAIDKKHALIP